MESTLTPCLICEKAVVYLWPHLATDKDEPITNLNDAVDVQIVGSYGSSFDTGIYHAIICDDCMDKAIQSKRVTFVRSYL